MPRPDIVAALETSPFVRGGESCSCGTPKHPHRHGEYVVAGPLTIVMLEIPLLRAGNTKRLHIQASMDEKHLRSARGAFRA